MSSTPSNSDAFSQSATSTGYGEGHTKQKARAVAIKVINSILLNKGSLSTQLARHSETVANEHQAQLKELCFGVCRWFPRLNSIALSMLTHPFEEEDQDLYAALLIGLYQLEYMDTPDHAAVNEAVEASKSLDKAWAGKLINAVLRRFLRERDTILEAIEAAPSVEYAHPKWLLKRLSKHWPDQFEAIVDANNVHPPMCLRVNQQHVPRETMMELLVEAGIESEKGEFSTSALYLKKPVKVTQLPNFSLGHLSVQDEAAQLSAQILQVQKGDKVLDACAAPGGKAGHLLESAEIELTAIELEPWRLEKIEENLDRLGQTAKLICADAGDLTAWWDGSAFDKILLDAPCTATGVIRRNPDIKVNRKPSDITALVAIQKRLLTQVWQTLKPGGQLLYATCSLMPEENEQQIADFLAQHTDATETPLPLSTDCGISVSHGRQLFPQIEGHDGFYYCLLTKQL